MFVVLQASDNAKQAEDNARKAKSAVKMVLNTISALLEQLGKSSVLLAQVTGRLQLISQPPGSPAPPSHMGSPWVSPQETSTEST